MGELRDRCKYNKMLMSNLVNGYVVFSIKFFQVSCIFEIFHEKMLEKIVSFVMIFREGK